jgi:hypothetical protein
MKLSKRQRRLWRYQIHQLKKHFSPGVPVEVHLVPRIRLKGPDADCGAMMKLGRMVKIVIRISQNDVWKVKSDSLIHEWAHAMEWEVNWTDDSAKKVHGETWGVWYAKIYQHLVDECWQDMKERGLLRPDQLHLE